MRGASARSRYSAHQGRAVFSLVAQDRHRRISCGDFGRLRRYVTALEALENAVTEHLQNPRCDHIAHFGKTHPPRGRDAASGSVGRASDTLFEINVMNNLSRSFGRSICRAALRALFRCLPEARTPSSGPRSHRRRISCAQGRQGVSAKPIPHSRRRHHLSQIKVIHSNSARYCAYRAGFWSSPSLSRSGWRGSVLLGTSGIVSGKRPPTTGGLFHSERCVPMGDRKQKIPYFIF